MSKVTHKVVRGDTLSALAKKYGTTVDSIMALNNIKNANLIYVGQVLTIKGGTVNTTTSTTNNATQVKINGIGLQANSDNILFVTWDWSRQNTEHYIVEWSYDTGNGVWFTGSNSTTTNAQEKHSTYTPPNNAVRARVRVKPISKTYKNNKNVEVSYWQGQFSWYLSYAMINNPPEIPPVPTVTIEEYRLTMKNTNLDINATKIEYEIYQDDVSLIGRVIGVINTGAATYSLNVNPGFRYKVRARGGRNDIRGPWSEYSSDIETIPTAMKSIRALVVIDATTLQIKWDLTKGATTYDIEYAEKEGYLGNSNNSTTITGATGGSYIIANLPTGKQYYFRMRAVNSVGASKWSSVKSLTIGVAPEPPSTWSDRTSASVGDGVLLGWTHNSKDDSEQTESVIELNVNGTISTIQLGKDSDNKPISTYLLNTKNYLDGTTIRWRVKTRGISWKWSEWSVQRAIDVYAPPTLSIELRNELGWYITVLKTYPLYIDAITGPVTQEPLSFYVSITANQAYISSTPFGDIYINKGDEIYNKVYIQNYDLSIGLTPGDINLENGMSYDITCGVTMNSGLSASNTATVTVEWDEVFVSPNGDIMLDNESLTANIRPYCERYENRFMKVDRINNKFIETEIELPGDQNGISYDGVVTNNLKQVYINADDIMFCIADDLRVIEVDDVELSIYRRSYDGKFIEVATNINGDKNTFITDPHPSLDYCRYRIVATNINTGTISYSDIEAESFKDEGIVIQWDEKWSNFISIGDEVEDTKSATGSLLRLPYNVSITENNNPQKNIIEYIGREHPVSYYGTNLGVTSSWTTDVDATDVETLHAIRRLSVYMGNVYVRERSGIGYWANITVSYNMQFNTLTIPITFEITRVDGGV